MCRRRCHKVQCARHSSPRGAHPAWSCDALLRASLPSPLVASSPPRQRRCVSAWPPRCPPRATCAPTPLRLGRCRAWVERRDLHSSFVLLLPRKCWRSIYRRYRRLPSHPIFSHDRSLSAFDCLASHSPPQVPRSFESTVWFHSQGWSMFPAFQCFAGTLQRIRGTGMKHP